MNDTLLSCKMYNKDLSKKRDMNSLISKLEQDDKILAELDNRLRSVSRQRTFTEEEDEEEKLAQATEKSSSLPSLNSYGVEDWKSEPNAGYEVYRKERSRQSSASNKLLQYSNELKRIEESLKTGKINNCGSFNETNNVNNNGSATSQSILNNINNNNSEGNSTGINITANHHHKINPLTSGIKDRERNNTSLPLISNKHSTKIESSYVTVDKNQNVSLSDKKKKSKLTNQDLDQLMEKLDQDNKILAELDKKLKKVTYSGLGDSIGQLSSSLPSLMNASNLQKSSMASERNIGLAYLNQMKANILTNCPSQMSRPATELALQLPQQQQPIFNNQLDELKQAEEIVDSIEIPNRGRCNVFIARYNYDPYKQSPNDNPEAEVTLLAGDFILVYSNIDEDGFYYGELLDGRRGLVPSNFIEKLTGEDLFEFQASVLYGHNRDSESDTASFPPEFYDAILNETIGHTNFQHLLAPDDFHRINDYIDLEDATEIDEDISDMERAETDAAKTTVAPPQRLILERQLHKSVLIGWLHPENSHHGVDHYQIYVDGVLKSTIPAGDRTKALVEGVDSSMPHRISVRAVDRNGRFSRDPGCTIVIGKSIPFAPCCVKAASITSDSALISWIPCNSNFYHVVAVNSVEVRTVKPSVYKHLITGLSANTLYRVSVRAKPGKLLCCDEKNPKKLEMLTTFVDFRTLPKSLPDPPVDIQVESGPQEGVLLVTWLPITLNQFGTSNNCPVTGYAVFAGHKKLAEIDSPTGDHALLDIGNLEHLHKKQITVRTKSGENLSQDSMPCQIPDDLLKLPAIHNSNLHMKRTQHQSDSESDTELTRLMHNVARRSKDFDLVQLQYQQQKHPQQNLNYDLRHKMMTNRQIAANMRTGSRLMKGQMVNMQNVPQMGMHHQESYSEEEFDASMKPRVHGQFHKRTGMSPLPPQRTRVISDFERSNFGPYNQISHRRPQSQRDREHGVRWFVALFDYDPLSMSPNPDAAEEELPFQEGQLIKIYGDKDADGFYRGEANGRIGYVPCNMVSEVQYDVDNDPRFRNNPNDPWGNLHIRKMIALYDYDPQELSPNFDSEMELAFRTGDVIYVYGEMDEDGFYKGEVNGIRGLVPSNFLSDTGSMEPLNARHGKVLLNQQQQLLQQQQQQQSRLMNPNNPAFTHSQGLIQQVNPMQSQFNNQRFGQPGTNFDPSVQAGMYQNQLPMPQTQQQQQTQQHLQQQQQTQMQQVQMQQQQQQQQTQMQQQQQPAQQMQQQFQQYQQQPQPNTGPNQQQMFQNQGTYQQQLQQQNPQLQANQAMGRGMRQQNPMNNTTLATQGQFNTMFQAPGTGILGNKQRPTSLDLNSGNPRFGQQPMANTGFNNQLQPQQPNQLQPPNQPQQAATGVLGSLFASGKKILEEATTPLGARGPFAHPNQPHQPMMGHHQPPQPQHPQQLQQPQHPQHPQHSQQPPQQGQMGFGQQPQQQQQPFNPNVANPQNQPPTGTILNSMKNLFKL